MSTLIVTNTNSSGAGSLAAAVNQANNTAEADEIIFSTALSGQVISLSGDLVLTNDVVINGDTGNDGENDIVIQFNANNIVVNGGVTASLVSLGMTAGMADVVPDFEIDQASVIANDGNLSMLYCYVANNTVNAGSGGLGENAATIVNTGTLAIRQSAFAENSNTGAGYASAAVYSPGFTGGSAAPVLNRGTLTLDAVRFAVNTSTGGQGGQGGSSYVSYYGFIGPGYDGGMGGHASGAVLNLGTISGNYNIFSNTVAAGGGGAGGAGSPDGQTGPNGSASNGLLNIGGGTGSLLQQLTGTMFADTVSFGFYAYFSGLAGADDIYGAAGSFLDGGAGNDVVRTRGSIITGGGGYTANLPSILRGGLGNDRIVSAYTVGAGDYDGGGGRDTIDFSLDRFAGQTFDLSAPIPQLLGARFTGFENVIDSQFGNTIIGGASANRLDGLGGGDTIDGGRGSDRLNGGAGKDTLTGGLGNDVLIGSTGKDRLAGGGGLDTLVLSSSATSADRIARFDSKEDTLQAAAAEFGGGLKAGVLAENQFISNQGGEASDASHRFILDTDSGQLFFDSNGDASGGSRLIATFTGAVPVLTNLDFVIV